MRCRKREDYFKEQFDGLKWWEMKKDEATGIAKQLLGLVWGECKEKEGSIYRVIGRKHYLILAIISTS